MLVRRRERGRKPQQRGAHPPPGDYTSQQPPRGALHAGTCSPFPLKAAGEFTASVAPGAGGVLMRAPGGEPGLAAALERYQRRLRGERGAARRGGPERFPCGRPFPWSHGYTPASLTPLVLPERCSAQPGRTWRLGSVGISFATTTNHDLPHAGQASYFVIFPFTVREGRRPLGNFRVLDLDSHRG